MQSKVSITGRLIAQALVFFYLYSVQFVFVPFNITTRVLISMCGFLLLVLGIQKQVKEKKDFFIRKDLIVYAKIFTVVILLSVVSIVFNHTADLEFIKYPFSLCLILLAVYFIHFILKKIYKEITYEIIMTLIINAVLIQVFIAFFSFLSPAFNSFLSSIQNISEIEIEKTEQTMMFRFVGFASTFFGSGIINGFALMLLGVLIKKSSNSYRRIILLSCKFLLILVLGMMMSRTTLVGCLLAFFYLLLPSSAISKTAAKNVWQFFVSLIIIPLVCLLALTSFMPKMIEDLTAAANFGFEMFINYYQEGELTTASTTDLQTLYIFPEHTKTYIIGDGQYYMEPGNASSGYYMGTDVGYLRLLFYFGLFGMVSYFVLQYLAMRNVMKLNNSFKEIKQLFGIVFFYCLILNIKGFGDLFYLTALFYFPFTISKAIT